MQKATNRANPFKRYHEGYKKVENLKKTGHGTMYQNQNVEKYIKVKDGKLIGKEEKIRRMERALFQNTKQKQWRKRVGNS